MAVGRQDMLYKDYTSNPIPTSFFSGSRIALLAFLLKKTLCRHFEAAHSRMKFGFYYSAFHDSSLLRTCSVAVKSTRLLSNMQGLVCLQWWAMFGQNITRWILLEHLSLLMSLTRTSLGNMFFLFLYFSYIL